MSLDLAAIKFAVDTKELDSAITKLGQLKTAADSVSKEVVKTARNTESANKQTKELTTNTVAAERAVKSSTSILKKQGDVLAFMAEGFTKGQSSVLAMAKASGASVTTMKELKNTLESIFKLAGKNPFDDSVDPVKRLKGEIEKLDRQMKVLKGETSLTVKQLQELTVAEERAKESARQRGISGAAQQSMVNKVTREFMGYAEQANKKVAERNKLLDDSTRKAKEEQDGIKKAAQETKKRADEQQRLLTLVEKTARVNTLKQEGFSTTSANQIFRMEKAGMSQAQIDSFKALRRELDEYNKKTGIASQVTEGLSTKFVGLQGVVRALLPGFGALSAGAISAGALKKIVDVADAYGMLQSRLKLTGADSEQLGIINEKLLKISNDSRTSLNENTQLYVKLANALKNYGGTSVDAINVTSAFSKALVIGGANTKEAAAATLQFAQALGSGKLAGDEFRSIAEASPRVLQAIADGTGKTTGELKKLASEGFLTTATVTKALISQLAILNLEMSLLPPTVGQAFTVLGNNTTSLIGELDKATGFTRAFANAVLGVANSIPTADQIITGFNETIRGFGRVIEENKTLIREFGIVLATIALPYAVNTAATIASTVALGAYSAALTVGAAVATTYRGVLLAVALAGGGLTGVFKLMTTAVTLFSAALFKNPIGIAIAAIGTGLTVAFGDNISQMIQKVSDKLQGFNTEVEKVGKSDFQALTGDNLKKKLEETRAEVIKTKKMLGIDLTGSEKESEKNTEKERLKSTQDFLKLQQQSLYKQLQAKEITQEKFEAESRMNAELVRQQVELQKLNETRVKDKPVELKDQFNLSNISKVYEAQLTAENQLQSQQKRLIDANVQYRLISEGQAFVQREKLAKESYTKELAVLEEFRSKIASAPLSGTEQQQENQKQQKAAELAKLDIKISQLKTERDMNVELAKRIAIGQENERTLEVQEKSARIRKDIEQDIQALISEQQNLYKDPAVIASEQARIKAADKYTETIAKQENILQFLKDKQRELVQGTEEYTVNSAEISRQEQRILELKIQQGNAADRVAEAVLRIRKENQSVEAGFKRFFANFRNEANDLSRVSENFARGFFDEFDKSFVNIFKTGKIQFGNLFKFIREELKKLAIQKLLLEPIKLAIEPIFKSISTSVLGAIGIGSGGSTGSLVSGASAASSIGNTFSLSKAFNSASNLATGAFTTQGFAANVAQFGNTLAYEFAGTSQAVSEFGLLLTENSQLIGKFGSSLAGITAGLTAGKLISGGRSLNGGTGNGLINFGTAAGALLGGLPTGGIGAGLGALIGGALAGAVNRLFGKKPAAPVANATIGVRNDYLTGSATANRGVDPNTLFAPAFELARALSRDFYNAMDKFGLQLSRFDASLFTTNVDFVSGTFSAGDRRFGTNNATEGSLYNIISNLKSGINRGDIRGVSGQSSGDVASFIRQFDTSGELSDVFKRFDEGIVFASQYRDVLKTLNEGIQDFASSTRGQALAAVTAAQLKIKEFKEQVKSFGLSLADAKEPLKNFALITLGLKKSSAPMTEFDINLQQIEARFSAMLPLLLEVGYTAGEAQGLIAEGLNKAVSSLRSSSAAGITAIAGGFANEFAQAQQIIQDVQSILDTAPKVGVSADVQKRAIDRLTESLNSLDPSKAAQLAQQLRNISDGSSAYNEVISRLTGTIVSSTDGISEAQERLANILQERKSLEDQLFNLTATSAQIRERERNALDESNRALYDQIKSIEDQKVAAEQFATVQERILQERKSLEDQLFQLTATSAQIRERERNALDSSNRALYDQIKAIEDQKVATEQFAEAQKKAAEESVNALEKLRGFGKSIRDFINSVRFGDSSPTQNLSTSESQFNKTLALTRSSDVVAREEALRSIPDISKTYLDVAKQYFGSSSEYQKIQKEVLSSLESLTATVSFDQEQSRLLSMVGVASAMGNAFSNGKITPFAKGGTFTNSVVSKATLAPMSLFGEAGPEAIMPLTRGTNGVLGVRSYGSFGNSELVQQLVIQNEQLFNQVENLTRVLQAYAKADLETSGEMLMEQRSTSKSMRQAAESQG